MRPKTFRRFTLIVAALASAPVLAGVGATSSGVTSTIGNQGTNASADVQQQSAGFVQQNQQLQAAQNGAAANGTMPAGATSATGGAKALANPANGDAGGKPGDPANGRPATPAAPPPPPPPPPTYVSVVKHITPQIPDGAATPAPPAAVVPIPVAKPMGTTAGMPKVDSPPVAKTPPAVPPPSAAIAGTQVNANNSANATKRAAGEHAVESPAVGGGRGPAPDGYTFYVGLGVAALLLVFALGAYLSSQKDEAARRPSGNQQ